MTDIMFELPEMEHKDKYVITEAVLRGEMPMTEKKLPLPVEIADKKSA